MQQAELTGELPLGWRQLQGSNKLARKQQGAFFTPLNLAKALTDAVLDTWARQFTGKAPWARVRICDPAVGDGVFLVSAAARVMQELVADGMERNEAARWIASHCVFGVDRDGAAVQAARRTVAGALGLSQSDPACCKLLDHLRRGDSLRGTASLIEEQQLHAREQESWYDRFPDVMAGGGFDVIIGNPPWEVLKPNDREFFEEHKPGFRLLPPASRAEVRKRLLEHPEIAAAYMRYCCAINLELRDIERSPAFTLQRLRPSYGGTWETNTARLFLELSMHLVRPGGTVGLVIPASMQADLGTWALRRTLVQKHALEFFAAFSPGTKLFEGVDHPIALLCYRRAPPSGGFRLVDGLQTPEELTGTLEAAPLVDAAFVSSSSPELFAFPSAKSEAELGLMRKFQSHPALAAPDGWGVKGKRDLDETRHRPLFTEKRTDVRLLKGEAVVPFGILEERLKFYVDVSVGTPRSAPDWSVPRVAWRDVARPTMARRMMAVMCPPGYAIGNSLNYLDPASTGNDSWFLLGVLNSLTFEYAARKLSRNSHMNMFVVGQVPVPTALDRHDVSRIATLAKRAMGAPNDVAVRAELDAVVAQSYSLDVRDFSVLRTSFPRVDSSYLDLVASMLEGAT